jgi:hypothetical protein
MNAPVANLLGKLRGRQPIALALLLGVAVLGCGFAMSAVPQNVSTFDHANQAFAQGRYAESVKEYSAILSKRGFAVGVLINRGNAWQKLHQPGHAILDFERAAWLRPADGSIATTLQAIQRQAGIAVTQSTILRRLLSAVSFDTYGWIVCGAAFALAAVVLVARSRGLKWTATIKSAVAACTAIGIAAGASLVVRWPELDRAVVLDAATPVRVAPAAAAEVSFSLPAGDVVYVSNRYHDYVALRTADSRSGWVDTRDVEKIVGSIDHERRAL